MIVVDDGSTDGTGAIAREVGDPRLLVIRQDNRGEAAARNSALAVATGEFLGFLDADDAWLPEHLQVTVEYLQGHPEHAAVYTDGHYITANGTRLKTLSSRRHPPVVGRAFDAVALRADVVGPPLCVVLRRASILRDGLRFDEGIGLGTDWEFFIRLADAESFGYVESGDLPVPGCTART